MTCLAEGIILCSKDVETGRNWIKAIKEAVEFHIETRKTIRKDSSKRQPMRKKQVKKFENLESENAWQKKVSLVRGVFLVRIIFLQYILN